MRCTVRPVMSAQGVAGRRCSYNRLGSGILGRLARGSASTKGVLRAATGRGVGLGSFVSRSRTPARAIPFRALAKYFTLNLGRLGGFVVQWVAYDGIGGLRLIPLPGGPPVLTSEVAMSSSSDAEQQAERRATLENDRRVREQQQKAASTYMAFSQVDADEPRGRFQNMSGTMTVIGATAIPSYPELPANSPWHHDPVPNEEPLGHRVDEMSPLDPPAVGAAAGVTGDPTSSDPLPAGSPCPDVADVERDVGSPSSSAWEEW
jgi:hypothetical protein